MSLREAKIDLSKKLIVITGETRSRKNDLLREFSNIEVTDHRMYSLYEPEISLDARDQLKKAKDIAIKVSEGYQVMITTNSEIIIRQLNHLIYFNKLNSVKPDKWKELCELYDYSADMLLDKEDVAVYFLDGKGNCESIEVDDMGFSIPLIEEVLMQLNSEIYFFNDFVLADNYHGD